jgi:hypothetical protein
MAADNHTTIVGNLVEDPEVRFANSGIAVANLRNTQGRRSLTRQSAAAKKQVRHSTCGRRGQLPPDRLGAGISVCNAQSLSEMRSTAWSGQPPSGC